MRFASRLLALPASILILIASHATSAQSANQDDQSPEQWTYNFPPHVKFWPEDPPHRRRDLEAIEEHIRLGRKPVGVMKMSPDEGEKFYMEYWQFEGELGQTEQASRSLRRGNVEEEARLLANTSMAVPFKAPFMLHTEDLGALNYEELRM